MCGPEPNQLPPQLLSSPSASQKASTECAFAADTVSTPQMNM